MSIYHDAMHQWADPERALAFLHVPPAVRAGLATLWSLDTRLGDIVRATREPLIGEMRLTWWRDALLALNSVEAPAEPLLQQVAILSETYSLTPDRLAVMAEGWVELLTPFPIDDEALLAFAARRGGALFEMAGLLLNVDRVDALQVAGQGWSLVDFAFHCSDADTRRRALSLAVSPLELAFATRWQKQIRPLGMIATLALRDARAGGKLPRRGSPARQFAMLRHRLTGR